MIPILILAALALDCYPVAGDRIMGRDLAAASPAFAAIPPDAVIGNAPQPGARRFMEAGELARIARANRLGEEHIESLCLERPVAPLDPLKAVEAMQRSLAIPGAKVQIVELSKFPAPPGELVFPRDSLAPGSGDAGMWKGYVEYPGGRWPIWATVRVAAPVRRLVAARDLQAGRGISADDVRIEDTMDFPRREAGLVAAEDAIGRLARRAIRAETPLLATDLAMPNDVEQGQTVRVEVHSGGATLKLEATAQLAGRRGETIPLRNVTSGKLFRGRIEERGRVVVEVVSESGVPK